MALAEPLADRLPLRDLPINVAGEWRRGRGAAYQSLYPADLSVSAELHAASADDASEAIEGAHDAFRRSGWAERKPHERALVLFRIAEVVAAATELPRGIRINVVSPGLVAESPAPALAAFPGFDTVSAARVALAYVRALESGLNGQVLRVT